MMPSKISHLAFASWALAAGVSAPLVGEGVGWLGFIAMAWALCLPRSPAHSSFAPSVTLLPQARFLVLLWLVGISSACLAWWGSGYGIRHPGAFGHALVAVGFLLAALLAQREGARGVRIAALSLVLTSFVTIALGLVMATAVNSAVWLEGWVRQGASATGQNLVPGGSMRVLGGLYAHRLKMAHVLLVVLGWVWAWVLVPRKCAHWKHMGSIAAFVLLSIALSLTYARAALLALGFAASTTALLATWPVWSALPALRRRALSYKIGALALFLALLAVLFVRLMLPEAAARLASSTGGEANKVRAVIWAQALGISAASPLGVGLGNYASVVADAYRLADPLTASPRTYPHNVLLAALLEGGPTALVCVALGWAHALRSGIKVLLCSRAALMQRRAALAGVFAALALGCVGLTHDVLFHGVVAQVAWTTLGLATWSWHSPKP